MIEGDPVLSELSRRCHQLLDGVILYLKPVREPPFKELHLGRLYLIQKSDYMALYMGRLHLYEFTNDMVYAEQDGDHKYSSWPQIYDALTILRMEMVLDDLASS